MNCIISESFSAIDGVIHLNSAFLCFSQSSLTGIYSQFLAALESLKVFWDVMDEIDEKTWVLEPEKPTRGATARRIALGNEKGLRSVLGFFLGVSLYFVLLRKMTLKVTLDS